MEKRHNSKLTAWLVLNEENSILFRNIAEG